MVEAKVGRPTVEHTPDEKANAIALLAKNEGNLSKTAKELDITPYMLRKLRDSYPQLYEAARRRMAEDLYDKVNIMAHKYADEILNRIEDEESLGGMKIKELAVVMGIAVDKINVMATVRSKFGDAQKSVDSFTQLSEEDLQKAVDAEFKVLSDNKAEEPTVREPTTDEDMSDTPKHEFPARSSGVSAIGSLLHSGGGKKP